MGRLFKQCCLVGWFWFSGWVHCFWTFWGKGNHPGWSVSFNLGHLWAYFFSTFCGIIPFLGLTGFFGLAGKRGGADASPPMSPLSFLIWISLSRCLIFLCSVIHSVNFVGVRPFWGALPPVAPFGFVSLRSCLCRALQWRSMKLRCNLLKIIFCASHYVS